MRVKPALWFILCAAVLTMMSAFAQDPPPESPAAQTIVSAAECSTPLSMFWLAASDACVGKEFGFVCNGGLSPLVEPQGAVSNSLSAQGALVDTNFVDMLRTPALMGNGENGGIAWLRVTTPNTLVQYSALLIGDVEVRNVTPEGFPRWQSLIVQTREASEHCEAAPLSSLVIQSLPNQSARVVVNGVSLDLNGTVVIQTQGNTVHFMNVAGALGLIAAGNRQDINAGQEISLTYGEGDFSRPIAPPSAPIAFRRERGDHLPVVLFDRPVLVPQAGYALTQGAVNLRTAPSTDAAVLMQVSGGERMTVLGRNTGGDWYHVRLSSGLTGWMFAELLGGQVGEIANIYEQTPAPLQRLGDLGQKARVIAPNGTTMRSAPETSFSAVSSLAFGRELNLLARSPYSPWVKVDDAGQIGWVALITLETRAIVDALPIDYDVPPPPEPTRIPGSFGGAFPDPNCYPNCG